MERRNKKKRAPRKSETTGTYFQNKSNKPTAIPQNRFFAWIFDLIDIGFCLFLAYQYFRLWFSPTPADISQVYYFATLMAFEFVMAHSGVFMAVMPVKWSLLFFFPFYGLFAWAFTSSVGDLSILWIYLIVVFNRMRFAFFNVDGVEKSRMVMSAVATILIYFFLMLFIAIFSGLIPELGLSKDFLERADYASVKRGSGLFLDEPQVAICFGAIYYILIAWADFKIKRVKGFSDWGED
ncbi:hypothetical protein [Bacteroides sp. 224]|uniref:hypothetical protein n=1 Tax=Bacteroides sp. 224 TaxID=2302936 RepID=UPI0013D0E439|nr:hypothetical protein [Bacteroides sp. 224]NDV65707.1 hypothetical protein [Bacteroides sp. 224]